MADYFNVCCYDFHADTNESFALQGSWPNEIGDSSLDWRDSPTIKALYVIYRALKLVNNEWSALDVLTEVIATSEEELVALVNALTLV